MKTRSPRQLHVRRLVITLMSLALALPAMSQEPSEIPAAAPPGHIKLAIAPFDDRISTTGPLSDIVRHDLELCEEIDFIDANDVLSDNASIDYADWRKRGATNLVVGSALRAADGRLVTLYRLFDIALGKQISGAVGSDVADRTRLPAHKIASEILQKTTGRRGDFTTRIAYVAHGPDAYYLNVAEYDGVGPQHALRSPKPVTSPAWAPDGKRLAYVTEENRSAVVYVLNLTYGQLGKVVNFDGTATSPSWSPDGNLLAITLTQAGSSKIFLVNPNGSGLRRLTNNEGNETTPSFSPDGKSIYFADNSTGTTQIFKANITDGTTEKLNLEGSWNSQPQISPDGQSLMFVSRSKDSRHTVLSQLILATGQVRQIAEIERDSTPAFAPSGRFIMLEAPSPRGRILNVISLDGRIKYQISLPNADISYPAWGPLPQ